MSSLTCPKNAFSKHWYTTATANLLWQQIHLLFFADMDSFLSWPSVLTGSPTRSQPKTCFTLLGPHTMHNQSSQQCNSIWKYVKAFLSDNPDTWRDAKTGLTCYSTWLCFCLVKNDNVMGNTTSLSYSAASLQVWYQQNTTILGGQLGYPGSMNLENHAWSLICQHD